MDGILAFTGESSFQGYLGGAGVRPSTVGGLFRRVWSEADWFHWFGLLFIAFARAMDFSKRSA